MSTEETKTQTPSSNENSGQKKPETPAPTEAQGDTHDEFGYEKTPSATTADKKPEEKGNEGATGYDKEPEEKKPEEKKPEEVPPVTGYDKEPEEKKPEEKKPDDKTATSEDFEIKDAGDLLPDDVKDLKEFIKANKVPKEVAQALVEKKKAEVKKLKETMAEYEKTKEVEVAKYKRSQYNELKNDSEFGGDKFKYNVQQVEKVLVEHFPNLKKSLTESKGMLPAYVMKDLAKLANHLFGTESLVEGGPVVPKTDTKKEIDPLDFYNS